MFGRNSLLFSGAIKMLLVSMNSLNAYEPQDNVGMTLAGTPTPTLPVTPRSHSADGGGVSGENFTNSEEKDDLFIFKDQVTSYRFTNTSNPVLSVNITGNVSAGEINIRVESLKNTSTLVGSPASGIVYRNVNIWVWTSGFTVPKNIKEALIKFNVENSWPANINLASTDIRMIGRDGKSWVQFETKEHGSDSNFIYYEASTDRFSPFTITGIKDTQEAPSTASASATKAIPATTAKNPVETEPPTIILTPKTEGFKVAAALISLSAIYLLRRR